MLTTLAVAVMVIVTGAGPHEKVMIPPAATAATTAAEVQLAGVPVPITRVGRAVLTACAAAGTGAVPAGLPAAGPAGGAGGGAGELGRADADGLGLARGADDDGAGAARAGAADAAAVPSSACRAGPHGREGRTGRRPARRRRSRQPRGHVRGPAVAWRLMLAAPLSRAHLAR